MDLKDFFDVVPKLPGVRVYQFVDNFEIAKKMADFAKKRDFELQIVTFEEDIYEKIKELKDENIKIRLIDEEKEKYNLRSIIYDTVFVHVDIKKLKNIEEFLKKIYRMMKNAANIVVPAKSEDIEKLRELFGKCNYVAINYTQIDNENVVFIAKKLHGWAKV